MTAPSAERGPRRPSRAGGTAAPRVHRATAGDVLALGGYLLVAVTLAVISLEPRFGTPWWIPLLLGLAGAAVLVVRRRHPLPAFGAAVLLALPSLAAGTGAEALLVLVTLYGAGVRRSAAAAWGCTAAALVGGAAAAVVFTRRLAAGPSLWGSPPVTPRDPLGDAVVAAAVVAVVVLITVLLGTGAGQRRRYVSALLERADRLARERDQQAEIASARERERIAREMHDVIAHSVSVMVALADGANAAALDRPDVARDAVARVAETGRRTLGEVRRLLGTVRDDGSEAVRTPQPDASRLPALIDESATAGLPVSLTVTGTPVDDSAVGLTVYRIVQESLTNTLRHARGTEEVRVVVAWSDEDVAITVRDRSAPAAPGGSGRGILGMRERTALFGGELHSGPCADGGWEVRARLRWREDRS